MELANDSSALYLVVLLAHTEGMHNPCLYQHKIITQMGNFNEGVHNPFLLSKYQHK